MQTDTSRLFVAISELDKFGIKLKNFPAIVVTGPQSSGKSSVLEAICGKSILPKKMGMATLKPIHLTTIRDNHQRKFQISDRDIHTEKDALDELERLNANPSVTKINVRIHAPDVYNSFLVDLPGLFYVTDEKTSDMPKIVKRMNIEYIADANNIPVVVLAAPTDPATNQALQLVNKHARSKDAFGIITKVDLTKHQSNELLLDMLHGKKYPLGYGYVAVVLRNTEEIAKNITIEEKIKDEAEFFKSNPSFPSLYAGTMQMRKKISTIQLDRIKSSLPDLLDNIDKEIESLKTSSSFLTNLIMDGNSMLSYRLKLLIEKLVGSSLERAEFEAELKNAFLEAIFNYVGNKYIPNNPPTPSTTDDVANPTVSAGKKQQQKAVETLYVDPFLEKFHQQFKTDLSKINHDTFKDLFSYGLISPLLVNTETLDLACTEESLLGCSIPLFKFKIDDPMGKKRLVWNNYLRKYFSSLMKDDHILELVYTITEKKILDYIFKDSDVDQLTRKFAEYIVKEIGSEAYESKIKFSIQSMINTEQRPQVSLIEIVRYLSMMYPDHFKFSSSSFFSKKNQRIIVEVYGEEWNRAYLLAVANQLANNIYRNVSVNLLDRMVERLLEMTIDMFNKDMTEKEKEKVNEKLSKLKEIRSIITSFHNSSNSNQS